MRVFVVYLLTIINEQYWLSDFFALKYTQIPNLFPMYIRRVGVYVIFRYTC